MNLKVVNNEIMFINVYGKDEVIVILVVYGEGNYYCDEYML